MKKTRKWLCLSISSFVLGIISFISGAVLHWQRKAAATYSVIAAFDGEDSANFQRFLFETLPKYLILAAIGLCVVGIILLVVHFVKSKKTN